MGGAKVPIRKIPPKANPPELLHASIVMPPRHAAIRTGCVQRRDRWGRCCYDTRALTLCGSPRLIITETREGGEDKSETVRVSE